MSTKKVKVADPVTVIKNTCSLLAAFGVAWVEAEFDGGHGSGSFTVKFMPFKPVSGSPTGELENATETYQRHRQTRISKENEMWQKSLSELRRVAEQAAATEQRAQTLTQLDALQQALYNLPAGPECNWKSELGSYGLVTIDVAARTIHIENHQRVEQIITTTRDF